MVSLLKLPSTRSGCPLTCTQPFHRSSHPTGSSGIGKCRVQQPGVGERSRIVAVPRRIFCVLPPATTIMAAASDNPKEDDPKNFKYIQLWASEDGETHIKECKMKGFDLQKYSSEQQFVKSEFDGQPTKMIFTELSAGLQQSLHPCPEVQFVITLSGSWYIETTDGSRYEFQPGEVLFQDNTKNSPAAKLPQHRSGAVGDQPCQQFIVQFNRAPETDHPEPF